jgi:hypothetical protein
MPLGRMKVNSLKDLTRVGSVLNRDLNEPSIYDLEDLQNAAKPLQLSTKNLAKFDSIKKDPDSGSSNDGHHDEHTRIIKSGPAKNKGEKF